MNEINFDTILNSKKIQLFTLTNKNGMQVKITNFGGKVVSIIVPDKNGVFEDVVLGYDNIHDYITGNPYFGAIIGRYANRISQGSITLNNIKYNLAKNNGRNHLHGGNKGFNDIVWEAKFSDVNNILELKYLSLDGEENYPGNLSLKVTYSLTDKNELK